MKLYTVSHQCHHDNCVYIGMHSSYFIILSSFLMTRATKSQWSQSFSGFFKVCETSKNQMSRRYHERPNVIRSKKSNLIIRSKFLVMSKFLAAQVFSHCIKATTTDMDIWNSDIALDFSATSDVIMFLPTTGRLKVRAWYHLMLKFNNVEPSQWLQEIYSHWIFLLCVWIDFHLWFVTSSFVGSFKVLIFVSYQQNKYF